MSLSISAIADRFASCRLPITTVDKCPDYYRVMREAAVRQQAFRDAAAFLREHGQLKWSAEKPTQPGTYWLRLASYPAGRGVVMVYAGLYGILSWTFHHKGDHTPVGVDETEGWWAGPIQEPVEETTP